MMLQESGRVRRIFAGYLAGLLLVALLLAALDVYAAGVVFGEVAWFDLDAERNLPTWFSGALFALFSAAAVAAYQFERDRTARGGSFRLPGLWLGVAGVGLLMSLDELTVLHENILWRETRLVSDRLGGAWVYLTQWQLVFAPAIFLVVAYFTLFFWNRLAQSSTARRLTFGGLAAWGAAFGLEAVRGALRLEGEGWYRFGVLAEESLEMVGAILLLGGIGWYVSEVSRGSLAGHRPGRTSKFLTPTSLAVLAAVTGVFLAIGGAAFWLAGWQEAAGAPLPALHTRAVGTPTTASAESESVSPVWFEDLEGVDLLAGTDAVAVAQFMAASLTGQEMTPPPIFETDTAPRMVFVSWSDGASAARVVLGAGMGIVEAVEAALALIPPGAETGWVKVDLVGEVHRIESVGELKPQPIELDRTLYGLAFDLVSGIAFLPEEVAARDLIDGDRMLSLDNIARYLGPRRAEDFETIATSRSTVFRFATAGFFWEGGDAVQLYRGHRQTSPIKGTGLLEAAVAGGDYLVRMTGPDGRFTYRYDPATEQIGEDYNLVRHAGTVYAMLELYGFSGDDDLLAAAERAIRYLTAAMSPCNTTGDGSLCVIENGSVSLGANALAVLALSEHARVTGAETYLDAATALAGWIVEGQTEDGQFSIHRQQYPEGAVSDFKSDYYPGEAVFALARLYRVDPQARWLDAAERAAKWMITVRDDVADAELVHDHWLLYGLDELHRLRPDQIYLTHAARVASVIVESQNRTAPYPDWLGGYFGPPRTTPTATRSEGLAAAYRILRDYGSQGSAAGLLEALRMGVEFQLQTQLRVERVIYFDDPAAALGGFTESLTDREVRIDYVQHNLSSLLALYAIEGGGS